MPDSLQTGETFEPIGAGTTPSAVVAQGPDAHPALKEGETLEPIKQSSPSADGGNAAPAGAGRRYVRGLGEGGRNLLSFAKGAAQDLANPDMPVFLSDKPEYQENWATRTQGDDTMAEKYLWAPARHERDRALEEADQYAATHGWEAAGHGLNTILHTAGELIPGIGPLAGHLLDKAEGGDIAGAAGEGTTYAIAPKLTKTIGGRIVEGARDIPGVRTLVPGSIEDMARSAGKGTVGRILNRVAPNLGDREPIYPGANLPEAPTEVYPGAPEPAAPPPEVLRARGLAQGGYAPPEPAAALGKIPVRAPAPVYPGAHLPEHPGVFPGASFPAAPPPELLQASPLAAGGAHPVSDPAAALGRIPVRQSSAAPAYPAGAGADEYPPAESPRVPVELYPPVTENPVVGSLVRAMDRAGVPIAQRPGFLLKGSGRVNRILGPEEDLTDALAKSARKARGQTKK